MTHPIPPGADDASPRGRGATRVALQLLALALSLALLVWAGSLALAEENRERLSQLLDAGIAPFAFACALVALSILVNGLTFWLTLLPVHRLRAMDVVAVNAIATMLSPLPFKVSLISRVVIHRRRDGVRYTDLAAWFIAFGVVALMVAGPISVASLVRGKTDAWWWTISVGGSLLCAALAVVAGRLALGSERLRKWTLGTGAMLASAKNMLALLALRAVEMGALAGRFVVASAALGSPLSWSESLLAASVYIASGMAAPAGTLGAREGAVAGMAFLPLGLDAGLLAAASLLVTAAEIVTSLALGAAGALWIRPDRLLSARSGPAGAPPTRPGRRGRRPEPPAEPAPPPPAQP